MFRFYGRPTGEGTDTTSATNGTLAIVITIRHTDARGHDNGAVNNTRRAARGRDGQNDGRFRFN